MRLLQVKLKFVKIIFFGIFSRLAIILFERQDPQLPSQIMATKREALDLAAKHASTALLDAMCLVGQFLSETSLEEGTTISNRIEEMFPGRIRSPEIYFKSYVAHQ